MCVVIFLHTIWMILYHVLLILIASFAIIFWIKQLLKTLNLLDRWKKHRKE